MCDNDNKCPCPEDGVPELDRVDDRERRDDALDASLVTSVVALAASAADLIKQITTRDQEQYDRRQREVEELFSQRQVSREHYAHLERQGVTAVQGSASTNALGQSAIGEENVENVTDAPDTASDLPKS